MSKIFVALLAVFLFGVSAHATDKIRITVSGLSGQFMTFRLAQKRGFLKEEGIETEIIRITGAASRVALSNGEVDYDTGLGSNIGGAMTGLPITVVACYVPAPVLALSGRIKSSAPFARGSRPPAIFGAIVMERFSSLWSG
jgi:ABC-type nitrate/sulfonate/bicarbonate transport system substrate-binding protein